MPLSTQAQAIVTAFGTQPGVTAQELKNLQATIDASPALTDEVNNAVAQGHLQYIVPLNNPHAGGEYNAAAHEMRLPLAMLNSPASGAFNIGEPTFVLGHELQHGFNTATAATAQEKFATDLQAIAQSPAHRHDYTAPIGEMIAANRRDEAGAEISGWNAIVSAAQKDATDHHQAAPGLAEIYARSPGRMGDFIDVDRSHFPPTYAVRPNLTLNADMTMAATPHNIEGMGQNYFDRGASLGHNGNSSYANYYGSYAVGLATNYERSYNPPAHAQPGHAVPAGHEMDVNLAQLHLSPRIMGENGIDLGANTHPMPYVDNSTHPPTHAQFRHTINNHTYAPVTSATDPVTTVRLDDAAHPDHALFQQARNGVHVLDAQRGRTPDQRSDNLAAALVVAARRDDMHEIHHVALGNDAVKTFAVQGELHSPLKQITQVDTAQAVQTSVAQSSQAWDRIVAQKVVQIEQPVLQTSQSPAQHVMG
jgi:hypothetical protein